MSETELKEGTTYKWSSITEDGPSWGESVVLEAYDPTLHLVIVRLPNGEQYGWTPAHNLGPI